ncbi:nuclease-related domain-containing DEAD/DEAH box helicase [Agrococcus jejuensis]|uniref:AAA domain-containing protein n=1 Tax=Agrococcus jejuensis TaxID=399736 RepID=A0A1G8EB10_9MICO|nr:NERD domain-containing protein [Agrococcus jejuensis]SDH67051.1 AAA domain-containing protein [Agrococcus jejuensis]
MTALIPGTCPADAPPGEQALFAALRDAPGTEGWIAFHGLPIVQHARQIEGEADFVVLVPGEGLLVIEVKSHQSVELNEHNEWVLGGKRQQRSPITQARDNMRSVEAWLRRKGERVAFPIASVVWFTHIGGERLAGIPARIDLDPGELLSRADRQPQRLAGAVVAALRKQRAMLEHRGVSMYSDAPNVDELRAVRSALMPAFRIVAGPADRREARAESIRMATERQEHILEIVEDNDRILVLGPAGTGKTNLAIRAARRLANRDERVLVTCFNERLEGVLDATLARHDGVTVARAHKIMLELTGLEAPEHASDEWWNEVLPRETLVITQADDYAPRFTALVVDEAQDLSRPLVLDVLDSIVDGGLAASRSLVAGDFERQDIFRRSDTTADGLARVRERIPHSTITRLVDNARAAPALAELVEALTGDELFRERLRMDDGRGKVVSYADESEQQGLLTDAVVALVDDGYRLDEILVLAPKRDSAAARATDPWLHERLAPPGATAIVPNRIRWGTVHAYKGLESPAVILTDVDPARPRGEELLYVGATRATDHLFVLTVDPSLVERVEAAGA